MDSSAAASDRDWTANPYTKDELLAENVRMVGRLAHGEIEDGADPVAMLDKALDFIEGFVEGRIGMIVPPHMVPAAEMQQAVERGRELAARYGW